MNKVVFFFLCIMFIITICFSESGDGLPIKYIDGCQLDLNNDGKTDIALLFEGIEGYELIVLLRNGEGYNSFLLSKGGSNLMLSCHYGKEIKETIAGEGKGKVYKTNGTYLKLVQPESSSRAYFWIDGKFKEVWTSD